MLDFLFFSPHQTLHHQNHSVNVMISLSLSSKTSGNLVDWWHPVTKDKYVKKAQCIIAQYANYTIPELRLSLNGINTQGENIADNGGIKEAYRAYSKYSYSI